MLEKLDLKNIEENVFSLIGDQWMLITAGNIDSFNTMTASWGGLGVLWNKNVATIYVRPQRYTMEYLKKSPGFTLSFMHQRHKDILRYCGAHSGKDTNKVKDTGLKPLSTELGNVTFDQSKLVIECNKLYTDSIKESMFHDSSIAAKVYPQKDFHYVIIGEIIHCYINN